MPAHSGHVTGLVPGAGPAARRTSRTRTAVRTVNGGARAEDGLLEVEVDDHLEVLAPGRAGRSAEAAPPPNAAAAAAEEGLEDVAEPAAGAEPEGIGRRRPPTTPASPKRS